MRINVGHDRARRAGLTRRSKSCCCRLWPLQLERLLDLLRRAGGNRLLDEHGDTREALHDLHLDVAAGLGGAAEHRGSRR